MANEAKKDETRNSTTKYRGEVAICAALKWTRQLKELACSSPFFEALTGHDAFDPKINAHNEATKIITATPLGCVVCVGELYDSITSEEWMRLHWQRIAAGEMAVIRERTFGNYAPGRGVWRFRNVRKLTKPVPIIGRQFWFNLSPEKEAEVRANLPKPKFNLSDAVDSYMEFTRGPGYDPDPLRRYVRANGGHCSGGGGCS